MLHMASVRQLTRKLTSRPEPRAVEGVRLRHFAGPTDIAVWLELRNRAFARQKLGVGSWSIADFEREFLAKPWWRPERMWFAQTAEDRSMVVGTVTLARRGLEPQDKPVVHWLAVLPRYRGRGIGGLLMDTLEAVVWDAGERQVWLETHEAWTEAGRLYAGRGYVEVDAR
jgi:mycothiol synthase